ncbi:MAG: SGNH/GDSL hydrolase family protein [Gammaproteobacteria bacterium]|nr:SGNH/GDSL hydrolase family protein [Gammaproteobacteria bacterium]
MNQILVYSDSLTWGIIPNTRKRLGFDQRWPGVMENALLERGRRVRVIENCLNGRRTAWPDPYKPGRNGLEGVEQIIEMHSPLSLVIVMLGTNDFQSMHAHRAWHAAQGVKAIVNPIRRAPVEPGMPIAPIIVVAPPSIENPRGPIAEKFLGGDEKCTGLAEEYQVVADEVGCGFFDAASVTTASKVDGIHLDEGQHGLLGNALARHVVEFYAGNLA